MKFKLELDDIELSYLRQLIERGLVEGLFEHWFVSAPFERILEKIENLSEDDEVRDDEYTEFARPWQADVSKRSR